MDKDTTEELVLERYRELAGLVRDGQMVNKDKETRARDYVKARAAFIKQALEQDQIKQNSKYGEFIIQTNEVQYYVVVLILSRSFAQSARARKKLERLQLGHLIGYLSVCARNQREAEFIDSLEAYKDARDALAHKMFTDEKLSPSECETAIQLGSELITALKGFIKGNV